MGSIECAVPHVFACRPTEPNWVNWAGNQRVRARCLAKPQSIAELVETVREVGARGGRLRPVATGLSFSDILQTDDTLVVLTELLAPDTGGPLLPLEDELWRDETPLEPRVRVAAGARIRELNAALASAGLGFQNLGGFDGQTLIGAISTSTHGSGIKLGPLSSAVRSLDLVTTDGARYRIEPASQPITDRDKFARVYAGQMTLVQDDDWFQSVVVSLGCMGIIVAATVAVAPAYRLHERRYLARWPSVSQALERDRTYAAHRNYEILVNPYPRRNGEHTCLVTERNLAPLTAQRVPMPPSRIDAEDFAFRRSTQRGLLAVLNDQPRVVPTVLEAGLQALETGPEGHLDDSYRIYNLGKINSARVLSAEYFVPLASGAYLQAVDRLIEVIGQNQRKGIYQTSPFSLRFVRAADAYLSMAYGGDCCAIELPIFTEGHHSGQALQSYEQALQGLCMRPHWGQIQELTGTRGWLEAAYPKQAAWRRVQARLNHRGIFDNAFTDRLGISICPRVTP